MLSVNANEMTGECICRPRTTLNSITATEGEVEVEGEDEVTGMAGVVEVRDIPTTMTTPDRIVDEVLVHTILGLNGIGHPRVHHHLIVVVKLTHGVRRLLEGTVPIKTEVVDARLPEIDIGPGLGLVMECSGFQGHCLELHHHDGEGRLLLGDEEHHQVALAVDLNTALRLVEGLLHEGDHIVNVLSVDHDIRQVGHDLGLARLLNPQFTNQAEVSLRHIRHIAADAVHRLVTVSIRPIVDMISDLVREVHGALPGFVVVALI